METKNFYQVAGALAVVGLAAAGVLYVKRHGNPFGSQLGQGPAPLNTPFYGRPVYGQQQPPPPPPGTYAPAGGQTAQDFALAAGVGTQLLNLAQSWGSSDTSAMQGVDFGAGGFDTSAGWA